MIINDDHKFSFVHIPKCAGTSVRRRLRRFDQRERVYRNLYPNPSQMPDVFDLPDFGPVKYNHLSLIALQKLLPEEFTRILDYRSLTVIRDPYARFISALSERAKILRQPSIALRSKSDVRGEISSVLEDLSRPTSERVIYPLKLVTFQRQVDFIFLEDVCALSRIYRIDQLPAFFGDAFDTLEVATDPEEAAAERANATLAFRSSWLRRIEGRSGQLVNVARRIVPEAVKRRLNATFRQPGSENLDWILREPQVLSFVEDFYADDLTLWTASRDTVIERGTPMSALRSG